MSRRVTPYHRLAQGRIGLRELQPIVADRPTIVALPYAGGQSLSFLPLANEFSGSLGFASIDPPGHGWASGPPISDVAELVDLYERDLGAYLNRAALLVGASFGGSVAFALARRLEERGNPARALVLVATQPPHRLDDYVRLSSLDDSALVRLLGQLGGMPIEWIDQPDVLGLFLPALRADIAAFESFTITESLESTPVLAVGGDGDKLCRPEHLAEWARYCADFRCRIESAGHFVAQSIPGLLAVAIREFMGDKETPADSVRS